MAGPSTDFGVAVRFEEGRPVCHVAGELDLSTAPDLEAVIVALLERAPSEIVLDLGALRFLDGRGLDVIARSASSLTASGGRLTIRAANRLTQRLLEWTELRDRVHVEPARADDEHSRALTRAAQIPADWEVVRAALRLVVSLAEATIAGADGVTVSLAPHGPLVDVVAVDDAFTPFDRDQYAVGEGPCLAAAEQGEQLHITAMAREDRWPAFVELARRRGINSILSTPLRGGSGAFGALNMYSYRDRPFSDEDEATAELLASGAAELFDRCTSNTSAALERRVHDALASRDTIALARGILMGRFGLSAHEAFVTLRRESRRTSHPLRDVASAVAAFAEGGGTDDPFAE